jgi:subtilisin family serine protease
MMNRFKFKLLVALSILIVIMLLTSLVSNHTSARSTETNPFPNSLPFAPSQTSRVETNQLPPIAPGVVLVGFKPDVAVDTGHLGLQTNYASLSATLLDIGVQSIEAIFAETNEHMSAISTNADTDLSRIYRLRLAPNVDVLRAVQELSANPAVAYAEPDYLAHIIAVPSDPLYSEQWGLAQVNAPAAWDVVRGDYTVVIAIIDSGIDTTHADLSDKLWTNPGEIPGNGIDDDNNGYVDDIHGWNIVDGNADLSDNTGHGTQVAGVASADTNNGSGIAGVCWGCRIMPVKVTQVGGVANYSDIAAGVAYAAQKGAEVINLSLGGYNDSATLRAAIAAASQTAVVVGGAGNDNKSDAFYPAAYDDYVLAVASTTSSDVKVGTSNYGTWVDVSAPGEVITTTFSGGGYGATSGTSMAAPFVAGLAGLLRSQNPGWSANMVRAQIANTTDDIDGLNPGYEGKLGSGRINAGQAVTAAAQPLLSYESHMVDGELNGRPAPNSTVDLQVTLHNEWTDATDVQATLNTSDPYVAIITKTVPYDNIATYESGANGTPYCFSVSGSAPYAHYIPFTLTVTADGSYTTTVGFTVTTTSGIEHVSGAISSDTTWTNDKTYVVDGNLGVQSGVTLTIKPGTVIRFDGDYKLQIQGTLIADGTPAAPIMFTSNDPSPELGEGWDRIQFDDSSVGAVYDADRNYVTGSIIRYASIEYASWGIFCEEAAPFIDHNTIINHDGFAAIHCMFFGSDSDLLIVSNNTIRNRGDMTVDAFGGHALVTGNYLGDSDLIVSGQNITVTHNSVLGTGGLRGYGQGVMITHNLIAGRGMELDDVTVISNTIVGNTGPAIEIRGVGDEIHHNNIAGNQGQYDLYNGSSLPIAATRNWWGTTETAVIDKRIYDQQDDLDLGPVSYTPILNAPETDAPAYLYDLTLTPDPVGIEAITFDLTFSRQMDRGIDPIVAFGITEPYTTYEVVDNAQWLDDSHWRATYDVTSLTPRGAYTVSVSGAKGTDGMETPTDTRFSFTVDYAGEVTDQTPPASPSVIAGGKEGDASTVEAMWSASDPDSSITGYRYAIGSAAGATDIVNWTNSSRNSITRSGLGLVEGWQYWLAVQARNEGGLWSTSGYSAFVAGQPFHRVFLPLVIRNE